MVFVGWDGKVVVVIELMNLFRRVEYLVGVGVGVLIVVFGGVLVLILLVFGILVMVGGVVFGWVVGSKVFEG